ncbi:MAG: type II toxin-antitoxin system RelB family antitoxin [Cumulibacter sp.]
MATTTTITLRLAESEKEVLAAYAKTFGMSISEFVRTAALSRIEDELDLVAWENAKREFDTDPTTLTADEVAAKYL